MRKLKINPRIRFLIFFITAILVTLILSLSGYVVYIAASYNRIDDNTSLSIVNPKSAAAPTSTQLSITTFNIGFGAYERSFSFFMDTGEMLDGRKTAGKYAKARNIDVVKLNTAGCINYAMNEASDFYFFQEVDEMATRSHKFNQLKKITSEFNDYCSVYAENYHSPYLFYPLNDPIGASNWRLFLSKYKVDSSVTRKLPIESGFSKFFDLDRCFSVSRLPTDNNKELVLINLHLSAFDKGGIIRKEQLVMLNNILTYEYDKGNYVIAGGDWNHDIADSIGVFTTMQKLPPWLYVLKSEDVADNFTFATSNDTATCRSSDIPYTKGINYTAVIDGFAVSDNIQVISTTNIDAGFKYSDHNPVTLRFTL